MTIRVHEKIGNQFIRAIFDYFEITRKEIHKYGENLSYCYTLVFYLSLRLTQFWFFFLLFAQFQTMKGRTLHDCADTTIKIVAMDAMLIAVLVQSINYFTLFCYIR